MIERILPAGVAACDTSGDPADAVPWQPEVAAIAGATEQRRREFATTRWCARRALVRLGLPEAAIPQGPAREPRWPAGVVGSLTHCAGYRAAALARAADFATVGIDAEPHRPCPPGVLRRVALERERHMLQRLAATGPHVCWDRLLFCAKEAVYKAWFPLTGRWLGFADAEVELLPGGTFVARLLVEPPDVPNHPLAGFTGRWLAADDLLLAAITGQHVRSP